MSRRAPRRQGPRPTGLFAWTAGAEVVEDQALADDDRRHPCPHCNALAWQPCTRPSRRGGRRDMRGVHDSRLHPQETAQ